MFTYTMTCFTCKDWTDCDFFDTSCNDLRCNSFCNQLIFTDDLLTCFRMYNRFTCVTTIETLRQWFYHFFTGRNIANHKTTVRTTVIFTDNHILGNVNETTCQVTWIGCFKGRVGHPFTGTMGREEHFQNGQAFTEVWDDWELHDFTIRCCHQPTHTRELWEVGDVTTGTRVHHHNDWIWHVLRCDQSTLKFFFRTTPNVCYHCITFIISHGTTTEFLRDLRHFIMRFFDDNVFIFNDRNICDTHSQTSLSRMVVTEVFETVKHFRCQSRTETFEDFCDDITQMFFLEWWDQIKILDKLNHIFTRRHEETVVCLWCQVFLCWFI